MQKQNALGLLAGLLCAGVASAAPTQWSGNGHWYEAIGASGVSWTDAKALAESMGGHLATITSADENDFVASLVPDYGTTGKFPFWLGGFRAGSDSNPAVGWEWVTGETWAYTNWASGEPNNANAENSLAFWYGAAGNKWNNAPTSYTGYGGYGGYVVEYVPEPAGLALVLTALVGLGVARKRKAR